MLPNRVSNYRLSKSLPAEKALIFINSIRDEVHNPLNLDISSELMTLISVSFSKPNKRPAVMYVGPTPVEHGLHHVDMIIHCLKWAREEDVPILPTQHLIYVMAF